MTHEMKQADRLCRLFCNVIDEVVTTRALRLSVGDEISKAQFEGLQYVYLHPRCCIKDLASGLDVSHPAAVKLVERLEGKRLIARSSFEHDRRVVQLEATAEGAKQAHRTMAARSQAIDRVLAKAGDGCASDLMACLHRFIEAALADERDLNGVCLRCGGNHVVDCPVCKAQQQLTGRPRTDS